MGGAEFRLPLPISAFRFGPLEAVIMNKAMSLVVVATALPSRMTSVPFYQVIGNRQIVVNLLVGSLAGAWFGASWATRLKSETPYRVIAVLLVGIAVVLLFGHHPDAAGHPLLMGSLLAAAGVIAGFSIGVAASRLGVAGGELLIPTIILLFGADVKLASSLSLAVSLPTMIMAFTRYSQDAGFAVLARNRSFLLVMAAGSIVGSFIGAQLVGIVPADVLPPLLAAILLASAFKVWGHGKSERITNKE